MKMCSHIQTINSKVLFCFAMIMVISLLFPVKAEASKKDSDSPSIMNAIVENITPTGYDVSCIARDNDGISWVAFPTWTAKAGQDDIIWHKGSLVNGKWIYHINISEHNNEQGEYTTHIYAFDKSGNSTGVALNPISISGSTSIVKVNNGKPDVRYTPIDFGDYYGSNPEVLRGMPGFTEKAYNSTDGCFRYYPEGSDNMWYIMEINYKNNKIYYMALHFYARDESYNENLRIWGIYSGQNGNEAIKHLEEHGYYCFYVQPSWWQWKDDGRYTVDIMWNEDGTVDSLSVQPSSRK